MSPSTAADRILTEAQCVALAEQVFAFRRGQAEARVRIRSHWSGELRWARNRMTLASDRQETTVQFGEIATNQLTPAALEALVRAEERRAPAHGRVSVAAEEPGFLFTAESPKSVIWSDATYNLTAAERARVARRLTEPAEAAGMLSAGYLAAEAQAYAVITARGRRLYARMSQGRCAMTVRDPEGTGSGWAGKSSYDWATINGPALAERAVRKCLASRHPVALEPGRYTVILEPQAVADLLSVLIDGGALDRVANENDDPPSVPFWLRPTFSKLGLKVADERVTIGQDPLDPALGALPFDDDGNPYRAVNWIDHGVLTALTYDRGYALQSLHENLGLINPRAFRMAGGETSIAEMIATTKRGLLVTRFSGVSVLNQQSLLSTGLTRDGLWLIEHGKITKPVKNFRFVDSPLFVLNSLEQLGPAEPVFRPGGRGGRLLRPAVVPPLKARDFSFTALADAV